MSPCVSDAHRFLVRLEKDTTVATAKESHRVLRSALSSACREELITRNVAKLVEPPRTDNRELKPGTLHETLDFLAASRKDPLYAAFVLAVATASGGGDRVIRDSDRGSEGLPQELAELCGVRGQSDVPAGEVLELRAETLGQESCRAVGQFTA